MEEQTSKLRRNPNGGQRLSEESFMPSAKVHQRQPFARPPPDPPRPQPRCLNSRGTPHRDGHHPRSACGAFHPPPAVNKPAAHPSSSSACCLSRELRSIFELHITPPNPTIARVQFAVVPNISPHKISQDKVSGYELFNRAARNSAKVSVDVFARKSATMRGSDM